MIRIIEGFETAVFKSKFDRWPQAADVAVSEEGRGKVAGLYSNPLSIPLQCCTIQYQLSNYVFSPVNSSGASSIKLLDRYQLFGICLLFLISMKSVL